MNPAFQFKKAFLVYDVFNPIQCTYVHSKIVNIYITGRPKFRLDRWSIKYCTVHLGYTAASWTKLF